MHATQENKIQEWEYLKMIMSSSWYSCFLYMRLTEFLNFQGIRLGSKLFEFAQ